MNAALFSQFEFLRAHVESIAPPSTSIMLTSAKVGDGKSLTAHGLAERLADSGRRVALVEFRPLDGSKSGKLDEVQKRRSYPILRLPFEEEGSGVATPVLRAKIDELRAAYEYTIIDSQPLLKSRIATVLAGIVDAIIVTVRLGRTADTDDTTLVQALGRADANVLGVVAAAAYDIAAFATDGEAHHPGDVAAPIHPAVTEFPIIERATVPAFEGWRH